MTDKHDPSSLAGRALQRLHDLAEGNGVPEGFIKLFGSEEQLYELTGVIALQPVCEVGGNRYAGPARGKGREFVEGAQALRQEVEKRQKEFQTKPVWINEALAQLKEQPGQGWGLDDVRVPLTAHDVILAASDACPSCRGSKLIPCDQCGGRAQSVCHQCSGNRQELCYMCIGTGQNPGQPGQNCLICNGLRYIQCRLCHGAGIIQCPQCHGRGGVACVPCKGTGLITEEAHLSCGARTSFHIKGEGLPAGLRRGLDRLGVANLVKGHAEIEALAPVVEDDERPRGVGEAVETKPPKPELHYIAKLPYADMRMAFGAKKVIVGVFGKKAVLLNVPPFLDEALRAARRKLAEAAKGGSSFDDVLAFKVMQVAMRLHLLRQTKPEHLRRFYPQGLSPAVMAEIMGTMRLALNRLTLKARSLVAVSAGAVAAGVFAALFLTPVHAALTAGWKPVAVLGMDSALLGLAMGVAWLVLSASTKWALQKRFPDVAMPTLQKTGKTGVAMLVGIVVAFAVMVLLTPHAPLWLRQ